MTDPAYSHIRDFTHCPHCEHKWSNLELLRLEHDFLDGWKWVSCQGCHEAIHASWLPTTPWFVLTHRQEYTTDV